MKKQITIRCYDAKTEKYFMRVVDAEPVGGLMPGFSFYIHRDLENSSLVYYQITEESTGYRVTGAGSKELAITRAKELLKAHKNSFPSLIREVIEKNKKLFTV